MVPGLIHSKNFRNQKFRRQQREKKRGWLSLTTTTKRSWSKEDHVHQGQYQRKKLKEPCVEEEIIDGLEGSSVQKKKVGSL